MRFLWRTAPREPRAVCVHGTGSLPRYDCLRENAALQVVLEARATATEEERTMNETDDETRRKRLHRDLQKDSDEYPLAAIADETLEGDDGREEGLE